MCVCAFTASYFIEPTHTLCALKSSNTATEICISKLKVTLIYRIFHVFFPLNAQMCLIQTWMPLSFLPSLLLHPPFRHEQPWGVGAGGEGIPNALRPRLPSFAPWTDAAVLETWAWWEAHLWVPAVLPGGLLHRHRAAVPARREPVTTHVLDKHGTLNEQRDAYKYSDRHVVVLQLYMLSVYLILYRIHTHKHSYKHTYHWLV